MGVTSIYANSPRTATIIVCPGAIVIGFCLGVAVVLFLAIGYYLAMSIYSIGMTIYCIEMTGYCLRMTGYCLMEISIPSRVIDFNLMVINSPL